MQGSFDFTEQKEIVKRVRRKPFEARQDWQRAPKIIVTDELPYLTQYSYHF